MHRAAIPLLFSAFLHLLGFLSVGFASESLFLLFPAIFYALLAVGLRGDVTWVAWVTLICMTGGIVGTLVEFSGPLMAPAPILIGIILADLATGGLLVTALLGRRDGRRDAR